MMPTLSARHRSHARRFQPLPRWPRATLAGALALAVLVGLVGCSSIADLTSDYAATQTVLPAKADLVAPIARNVIQNYGFNDIAGQHNKASGTISAVSPAGERVTIRLTPAGSRTTRIDISNDAGKQVAQDLLREIERRVDAVTMPEEPLPWLREQSHTPTPSNPPAPSDEDDADAEPVRPRPRPMPDATPPPPTPSSSPDRAE